MGTNISTINLNACFPVAADGTQGPLPKQAEFIRYAIDANGPKYIDYIGGVGSGKTLIGCIIVIIWAVLYPGDYLVCRQFYPELKDTTLKTFLEVCPKELIVEHRIADSLIRIRSQNGKVSTVYFRPLEEPDKHRSMNLSGFYIDEASQVSEAAFLLLQGRLRGAGLRKGIMTSNVNGHDWQFQWFHKKDHLTDEDTKKQFQLIKAPSTENRHLPPEYVSMMLKTWSEDKIKREIYGDFDSFAGMVYSEFRRDLHVIRPFAIPVHWTRVIGCDHGHRNPAAWILIATDEDGTHYAYKEFYQKEFLINEICQGKQGIPGINKLVKGEKITEARMDPSTKRRDPVTGGRLWDAYLEYLPEGFPLLEANNEKEAGIDRVKRMLKPDPTTGKPQLYIFDTCTNLLDEFVQYRYAELAHNQQGKASEKEEPVKVDDHAMDALRYAVMCLPETIIPKDDWKKAHKYKTISVSLREEIEKTREVKKSDPFEGGI